MLLYPPSLSDRADKADSPNFKLQELRRKHVQQQVAERMLRTGLNELAEKLPEQSVIYEQALQKLKETVTKPASKKKRPDSQLQSTGARNITRREYPALVELKIAGRSAKEIARILEVPEGEVRRHLSLALSEYRNGKLVIRSGEAATEAREKGAEKSLDFYSDAGLINTPLAVGNQTGSHSSVDQITTPLLSITV